VDSGIFNAWPMAHFPSPLVARERIAAASFGASAGRPSFFPLARAFASPACPRSGGNGKGIRMDQPALVRRKLVYVAYWRARGCMDSAEEIAPR
jgi:hypothetical protein